MYEGGVVPLDPGGHRCHGGHVPRDGEPRAARGGEARLGGAGARAHLRPRRRRARAPLPTRNLTAAQRPRRRPPSGVSRDRNLRSRIPVLRLTGQVVEERAEEAVGALRARDADLARPARADRRSRARSRSSRRRGASVRGRRTRGRRARPLGAAPTRTDARRCSTPSAATTSRAAAPMVDTSAAPPALRGPGARDPPSWRRARRVPRRSSFSSSSRAPASRRRCAPRSGTCSSRRHRRGRASVRRHRSGSQRRGRVRRVATSWDEAVSASAGSIESVSPSSVPAYRRRTDASSASAAVRSALSPPAGTATSACASRGIALRLTPPANSTRPKADASIRGGENATERLDRVRSSTGDVLARVAALRSRDGDPQRHVVRADRLEPRARAGGTCGRFPRNPP